MKINWLRSLFRKDKVSENQKTLSLEKFKNTYPTVSLSEELRGNAYNLFFLIEQCNLDSIVSVIQAYTNKEFKLNGTREPQDKSHRDLILKINIFPDFEGYVVHIITSEEQLIDRVLESNYAPPLPTVSFQNVNPLEYGALQGNLDFWFQWLWLPYWLHLSASERHRLDLSDEWIEFIEERTCDVSQ